MHWLAPMAKQLCTCLRTGMGSTLERFLTATAIRPQQTPRLLICKLMPQILRSSYERGERRTMPSPSATSKWRWRLYLVASQPKQDPGPPQAKQLKGRRLKKTNKLNGDLVICIGIVLTKPTKILTIRTNNSYLNPKSCTSSYSSSTSYKKEQ